MTSRARLVAVVLAVAAIGAVAVWATTRGSDRSDERATPPGGRGRSDLTVIAVRGTPNALIAVVGVHPERPPAALVLPGNVTVVAPGQGETTIDGVAALSGESIRIAVSNAIGRWADRYAVADAESFAAAIDQMGGLEVDLSEPATLDGGDLGAGTHELSGGEVMVLLSETGDVAPIRWADVVEGLLEAGPLPGSAFAESDDAAGTVGALERARGAVVEIAPVAPVADQASVLDQPAADGLVRNLFGGRPPTPIVVENGNGEPNVGEVVAARLLPEGFQIVISQNADSFRHRRTEIAATAGEFADEAERVRELLGVGRVVVSQVPSGLADITIVVGRDFTA
ncbi:MAG TPA: LCP family protein [Actinomycetota bacterium]|nr:LCP family protein [Actinomycetota bacterium]